MKFIDQDLYNQILENMPIICVDGILKNELDEILFLRRKVEPEKNKWWFPGGRLQKNEKLEEAIIRKFKEEVNLNIFVKEYAGVTQTIFETGINNIQTHTINFTFLVESSEKEITLDHFHSDFIWSKNISNLQLNDEIVKLLTKI